MKNIYDTGRFPPRELKRVLAAIQCDYEIVGQPRQYQTRIMPKKGHEKAIRVILSNLFGKPFSTFGGGGQ
jgi:hypothetical protein